MSPASEDLIVFLLFGAFVLVQILRNRRRSKRQAQVEPAATSTARTEAPAEPEAPVSPSWTPTLQEGPRQPPAAAALHTQAVHRSHPRRFARHRLLGDRRSLQDAIVVATILGPCRARRPHDLE